MGLFVRCSLITLCKQAVIPTVNGISKEDRRVRCWEGETIKWWGRGDGRGGGWEDNTLIITQPTEPLMNLPFMLYELQMQIYSGPMLMWSFKALLSSFPSSCHHTADAEGCTSVMQ